MRGGQGGLSTCSCLLIFAQASSPKGYDWIVTFLMQTR